MFVLILLLLVQTGTCWEIAPGGFTDHFRAWLKERPEYDVYGFPQDAVPGGSFGGKLYAADPIVNRPIIFVPGGASVAQNYSTHFATLMDYGYRISELYAVTYISSNGEFWDDMAHRKVYVMMIRKFVEAVLEYTGAPKVDVISHSLGVTLSRKALKGGPAFDREERYEVGPPLTDKIETFIGIGGANYGLYECGTPYFQPIRCNAINGFYPGVLDEATDTVYNRTLFLQEMIDNPAREANHVYAIYSRLDEYFGDDNLVHGRVTTSIPGQTGAKVYDDSEYTHCSTKDKSIDVQFEMMKYHRII